VTAASFVSLAASRASTSRARATRELSVSEAACARRKLHDCAVETLVEDHHPGAVEEKNLQRIFSFAVKDEKRPRTRVVTDGLSRYTAQSLE